MKNYIKYIVGGVVIVLAFGLGWYLHQNHQYAVGAVTNGATNSTAQIAEQSINAPATSTLLSILNTSDNTEYINTFEMAFANGVSTTSTYTIQCATSSVATSLNGNTNYVVNASVQEFGTTTGLGMYVPSSTTPGVIGQNANALGTSTRQWAGGSSTYLVCVDLNSGNTGTALLDSGITGYLRFGITRQ